MTATGIDLDRETQYAVDALVYRLRNRGEADDEVLAREYVLAMRTRGWRPTPARPQEPWKLAPGSAPLPDPEQPGGADYLRVRAELDARLAAGTGNGAMQHDEV